MKYILDKVYKFYKNKNIANKFVGNSLFVIWVYSITHQVHDGELSIPYK